MDYETQKQLNPNGTAQVYLEDDMVFACGDGWCLTSPLPAPDLIRSDLSGFLCGYLTSHPRTGLDFQVLTAKKVATQGTGSNPDHPNIEFIPYDGLGAVPLRSGGWAMSGKRKIEAGSASLFSPDAVDLTALWDAGQATPLYQTATEFARTRARAYRFRVTDPSTGLVRVVQVPGGAWRGICAMGLRAQIVPRVVNGGIPPVGVLHPTEAGRIFGVIDQHTEDRISVSDDGRDLLYDGAQASWVDDDVLLGYLIERNKLSTEHPPVRGLPDVLDSPGRYAKAVRRAVDVLRWRGVPDPAIDAWLRECLPTAYEKMFEGLFAGLENALTDLDASRYSSGAIPMWAFNQASSILRQCTALAEWVSPVAPSIKVAASLACPPVRERLAELEVFLEDDEEGEPEEVVEEDEGA